MATGVTMATGVGGRTSVQESGSTPSVLGECAGAQMSMFRTTTCLRSGGRATGRVKVVEFFIRGGNVYMAAVSVCVQYSIHGVSVCVWTPYSLFDRDIRSRTGGKGHTHTHAR